VGDVITGNHHQKSSFIRSSMPVWGYGKTEVFIIPAAPCTPDGIQHFLCARHDVGQTSTADDFWVVALGVVFQWWYRPLGLLRFDVTQRHFQELLVLLMGCWEVKIAVETVLGYAVGLCIVIHIISFALWQPTWSP